MIFPGRGTTGARSRPARSWAGPSAASATARQPGSASSAPTSACPVSTAWSASTRTARVPPLVRMVASLMRNLRAQQGQLLQDRRVLGLQAELGPGRDGDDVTVPQDPGLAV